MDITITTIVVGFISFAGFIYFLRDRYSGKLSIEFDEENVFALPIYGLPHNLDGALAIGLYDLNIKNLTKHTKTIKSCLLKYEFENNKDKTDSYVVRTKLNKENKPYITIETKNNPIVLINWKNLRLEINKFQSLQPEGILSGSALFILPVFDIESCQKIKRIEFLIETSKNKIYKQRFDLKDEYFDYYKDGAKIYI